MAICRPSSELYSNRELTPRYPQGWRGLLLSESVIGPECGTEMVVARSVPEAPGFDRRTEPTGWAAIYHGRTCVGQRRPV
jgi:hypothetical protein